MLSKYPNDRWMTEPIGEICQAVQVSAYPDRYQPQAGDAKIIVDAIVASQAPPARLTTGCWSSPSPTTRIPAPTSGL